MYFAYFHSDGSPKSTNIDNYSIISCETTRKGWIRNPCLLFVLWIYLLPRVLNIQSWAFLNSPLLIDFILLLFSYFRGIIDGDGGKKIKKGHSKTELFLFILTQALGHSWAPKNSHKLSRALLCIDILKSMMLWRHQCCLMFNRVHWGSWVLK